MEKRIKWVMEQIKHNRTCFILLRLSNIFCPLIGIIFRSFLNEGRSEFIFLKENYYLFNLSYKGFTNIFFLQLTNLILVAKDWSLKIRTGNNIL